jgi:hypothetical protein
MMGLKQARAGRRILLTARLLLHPGQQKNKVLNVAESALIKRTLSAGHDLLNQQGTKTKVHVIRSKGNTWSRQSGTFRNACGEIGKTKHESLTYLTD